MFASISMVTHIQGQDVLDHRSPITYLFGGKTVNLGDKFILEPYSYLFFWWHDNCIGNLHQKVKKFRHIKVDNGIQTYIMGHGGKK